MLVSVSNSLSWRQVSFLQVVCVLHIWKSSITKCLHLTFQLQVVFDPTIFNQHQHSVLGAQLQPCLIVVMCRYYGNSYFNKALALAGGCIIKRTLNGIMHLCSVQHTWAARLLFDVHAGCVHILLFLCGAFIKTDKVALCTVFLHVLPIPEEVWISGSSLCSHLYVVFFFRIARTRGNAKCIGWCFLNQSLCSQVSFTFLKVVGQLLEILALEVFYKQKNIHFLAFLLIISSLALQQKGRVTKFTIQISFFFIVYYRSTFNNHSNKKGMEEGRTRHSYI